VPGARLVVAGRGTDRLAIAGTGIDVLGEVPSAVDVLRTLSVLVYPVGRGSGMKVKVLEALALGVPVVTTTDGAEGIGATDGVVVADGEDDLLRATCAILRDPDERAQRSRAARAHFDAVLSPAPATAPLADLYRRMAGLTS
jgi:glycosyltransferase involved in cell wall biosynthesis